jgi:hypothetical protein
MSVASEMTFGVEIEVYLPTSIRVQLGQYHSGIQVPELPLGWTAEHDGSLCYGPAGHYGAEIVSPVLRGPDGLRQIKTVCDWLNAVGARVNRSTGFHVHIGFDRTDKRALRRLVTLVANFEKALFAITGTHSRERGTYCRTVQNDTLYQRVFKDGTASQQSTCGRYHVLNLTSVKPTVEFRVFAGTTSPTKAISYVRTCLALVEKAMKASRIAKWVAKTPVPTSPLHRSGEGQTATTRLFYALGWTKGEQSHVYGDVGGEDLLTIDEGKKELMRLARKYDGGDEQPAASIL